MARRHRVYRQIEGKKRYEHRAKTIVSAAILVIILAFPISVYKARNPAAINLPAAMDVAQVARNLARGGGFTTNILRPGLYASLPRLTKPPDIVNPPLHVWLLARLPGMKRGTILSTPDSTVTNFSSFFYLLTALLLFLLERRLSGGQTLAIASLIYLFSVPMLHSAVSGTGETLSAAMVTLLMLMISVDSNKSFLYSFVVGAVLGACYLTSYVFLVLLLPLIIHKNAVGEEGRFRHIAAMLVGLSAVSVPWMVRNLHFGANALIAQPFSSIFLGGERPPQGPAAGGGVYLHMANYYGKLINNYSASCVLGFFLISPVVQSHGQGIGRVKHFLWYGLGAVILFSLLGQGDTEAMGAFLPGAILVGSLTFQELIQRYRSDSPLVKSRLTVLFIALNVLPFVSALMATPPSAAAYRWHENRLRTMADMHSRMHAGEILMTNAPEWMAYYGEFNTLPLPADGAELSRWEQAFGQLRFAAVCPYGPVDGVAEMVLKRHIVPAWFISEKAQVYPGGEVFFSAADPDEAVVVTH